MQSMSATPANIYTNVYRYSEIGKHLKNDHRGSRNHRRPYQHLIFRGTENWTAWFMKCYS